MIRSLKALGLALVAVVAMSAMAASSASAANDVFTSEVTPTSLTGSQIGNNIFELNGDKVKTICPVARFKGTVTGLSATSITVHPEYEGSGGSKCEVQPLGSATVNTEGCNYIITGETDVNGDAKVELECDEGHEITINGPCVIHIEPKQTLGGGVSFVNGTDNGKGDVTVKATVTGIKAVVTDSFACTIGGLPPGTYSDGKYTGEVTVTGYKDPSEHKLADQVGISVS